MSVKDQKTTIIKRAAKMNKVFNGKTDSDTTIVYVYVFIFMIYVC